MEQSIEAPVSGVLPFVPALASPPELRRAIYEEFLRWFRQEVVGHENRYETLALDAWDSYRRHAANIRERR